MANGRKEEKVLTVSTPTYEGPERRKEVEVIVKKCFCHSEHQRRLNGFDKGVEDNKEAHKGMWEEMKTKVPNKLFYIFVAIVVGGLGVVYNGIHNVDKNLAVISIKVDDQKDDINELKEQLDTHDRNGDSKPSYYYNPKR